MTVTLSNVLEDLRIAEQALHAYEQRYWLSSDIFYELYTEGALDNGDNLEDFTEWAGHYKLKVKRENTLREFSRQRIEQLRHQADDRSTIHLLPQEPVLKVA